MQLFKRLAPKPMMLLVGLGNPGARYKNNRHNVGYMVIERLATHWGISVSKSQARSLTASHQLESVRVLLAKPQQFMNESGRSTEALLNFYKIPPSQMLVVYDELDLPLGAIRMRPSGGTGGHRGMRSIQAKIGSQEYPRMRVGIGRPPGRMDPADYVLHDFSEQEQLDLDSTLDRAVDCILRFLNHGIESAMTSCNMGP